MVIFNIEEMKFTFHIDAPIIRHKGGFIMSTIFPREEKAEQIFDEILKNPRACERLKDTFFAAIPSAEESEGAGTDIPGTVFAAALFNAYENKVQFPLSYLTRPENPAQN